MNAYDIETFELNNKIIPYCICLYIKNNFKYFYYTEKVDIVMKSIEFLLINTKKNEKSVIYVHNLNFDGMLIIESVSKNSSIKINSVIKENNIYSIDIEKNDRIVTFKCSYKILPVSLKKIAQDFKLPNKLIFPYKFSSIENIFYIGKKPCEEYFNSKEDYKNIKVNNFNFMKYSISYCKRDALITKKFMEILRDIVKKLDIDIEKANSAPSLSLKIFNSKFNKSRISLKIPSSLDSIIRKSYFGGRCEVFGNPVEGEYIYHYDFSGMYAQCMMEKFPFGKYSVEYTDKINGVGFYYIKAYSSMNIPILPHKNICSGKLMFTNGDVEGVYWSEEIDLFLENGGILKSIEYKITFQKYECIFKDFVDYFDKIKSIGGSYKTLGKLMINSLYGRLGMSDYNKHSFFIDRGYFNYISNNLENYSFKNINNIYLITCEISNKNNRILKEININIKKNKSESNIIMASCITSKARIKLFKAYLDVIKSGGRLLYSDTDSIFASYKRNVDNCKFGEVFWDISKKDTVIKKATFISSKSYGCIYGDGNEAVKIKGITRNSITYEELENKFYSNQDILIKDIFQIKKKNFELNFSNIQKNTKTNDYNKRRFINNKKDTEPLHYKDYEYK